MCAWIVRVRGIRVCGRQVYRSSEGIKLGYKGPTVSLGSALADLSNDKANQLASACEEIDRKMNERTDAEVERELSEDALEEEREFFPPTTALVQEPTLSQQWVEMEESREGLENS